jgi:hypothetical protein
LNELTNLQLLPLKLGKNFDFPETQTAAGVGRIFRAKESLPMRGVLNSEPFAPSQYSSGQAVANEG